MATFAELFAAPPANATPIPAGAFDGQPAVAPVAKAPSRRGFSDVVGQIADALAVMGGKTPGYRTSIKEREAKQKEEAQRAAFGAFMTDPTSKQAEAALAQVAPELLFKYREEFTPKPVNPGSPSGEIQLYNLMLGNGLSKEEALANVLDFRRKNVQLVGDVSGQYYIDPRTRKPVPLEGVGPKPVTPQFSAAPMMGADGRPVLGMVNARTGTIEPTAYAPPPSAAATKDGMTAAQRGKEQARVAATQRLGRILTQLDSAYTNLEKQGGIVGENQTALANLGASAAASGIGQLVGRALGTQSQTQRDRIAGMRGAIVSELKTVTGKTSGELNSIPELNLALTQATDPSMGIETNRAAIKFIYDTYLNGAPAPAAQAPPATPPAAGGFKVVGRRRQ
jgi:hypothetical protein